MAIGALLWAIFKALPSSVPKCPHDNQPCAHYGTYCDGCDMYEKEDVVETITCPKCGGEGDYRTIGCHDITCSECYGTGVITKEKGDEKCTTK